MARVTRPQERETSVFLNVPFDPAYEPLMIALVAGVTALGRVPRCVLELREGEGRLRRIVDLIGDTVATAVVHARRAGLLP